MLFDNGNVGNCVFQIFDLQKGKKKRDEMLGDIFFFFFVNFLFINRSIFEQASCVKIEEKLTLCVP